MKTSISWRGSRWTYCKTHKKHFCIHISRNKWSYRTNFKKNTKVCGNTGSRRKLDGVCSAALVIGQQLVDCCRLSLFGRLNLNNLNFVPPSAKHKVYMFFSRRSVNARAYKICKHRRHACCILHTVGVAWITIFWSIADVHSSIGCTVLEPIDGTQGWKSITDTRVGHGYWGHKFVSKIKLGFALK